MRRVRYGVGMSLDGYIADARGGTDWLVSDAAYDAGTFFRAVDTAIMGRITYEVARRQGMRGGYPGLRTYVCSRTLRAADHPDVTLIGENLAGAIAALRREPGKDMWLVGGGALLRSFLEEGLVDTVEVGVSPVLLGQAGAPLLSPVPPLPHPVRLRLTRSEVLPTGLLVLEYAVQTAGSRPGGGRERAG
ncbi:MAG TPA: dihydrofolate reductase family protein [Gemmatimonadaceae bacterium]|nr:dihydrofolate reductase family protein [Gemmatimonadaceae bacterium]